MNQRSLFRNTTYIKLFAAQVIALTGTGISTIALALLAHGMAGERAGEVLGIALALKMVAYVGIAPIIGGISHLLPRKSLMIAMDLFRALLLCLLPFIDSIWQIYLLVFLINAGAASFKPVYQGIIPDLLPDEKQYTRALSMFRIAYDMENILSPALAALLLAFWSYNDLFFINGVAFLISALLIVFSAIPVAAPSDRTAHVMDNLKFGLRSYLSTPRLRGLLSLYVAVACASAMVIVNTVVYVRDRLGGTESETAQAMLAVGVGSILAAMVLPRIIDAFPDRTIMLSGAVLLGFGLLLGIAEPDYTGLLVVWLLIGFGLSVVQIPSGRLITASCRAGDRTAFFAANFSLSHGCWFFAYLLAGYLGAHLGLTATFGILAIGVGAAVVTAFLVWPVESGESLEHHHEEMEHDHLHIHDEHHQHEHQPDDEPVEDNIPHTHQHTHECMIHQHDFIIDLYHLKWPS
ncbi:MAG: MFS transporter [Magnetococcales bacterium]|nr:MFS transporter [Magnetococcales bacterium]